MNNDSASRNTLYRRRLRAERRFRLYGVTALVVAACMLVVVLGSVFTQGIRGFKETRLVLPITFDAATLGMMGATAEELPGISASSFQKLAQESLKSLFPEVTERSDLRELYGFLSSGSGGALKEQLLKHPEWLGQTHEISLRAASEMDRLDIPADAANAPDLSDLQRTMAAQLKADGRLDSGYSLDFFRKSDSRQPEQAGFFGAMVGSLLTLIVTIAIALPIGVMTAVYLEEFARRGKLLDLIEVNINNLAAVPSIVFGLLGLAVYLNILHLPRSAPLVGGMTLALMILPVIIITTRAALSAVPNTIRDAARALGATPLQVVLHHTLPLSLPGIMTGTILGMARAIGETAPLLMIGMVAFIADVPAGFTSPSTVMPVQIYLWASSPERGYVEKTAAGILVLMALLLILNAAAIYIRKRFETRW